MKHFYYPDIQRWNPFRQPAWRWERAWSLVRDGKRSSHRRDDEPTRRALQYVRATRGIENLHEPVPELTRRFPDLHAAHLLYLNEDEQRWEVEARLLARQSSEQIASIVGIAASTIDAYEETFFHHRDRIDARDWILLRVIGLRTPSGPNPNIDGSVWRRFAYYGGPLILDVAIAATAREQRPRGDYSPDLLDLVRASVLLLQVSPLMSPYQLNRLRRIADIVRRRYGPSKVQRKPAKSKTTLEEMVRSTMYVDPWDTHAHAQNQNRDDPTIGGGMTDPVEVTAPSATQPETTIESARRRLRESDVPDPVRRRSKRVKVNCLA